MCEKCMGHVAHVKGDEGAVSGKSAGATPQERPLGMTAGGATCALSRCQTTCSERRARPRMLGKRVNHLSSAHKHIDLGSTRARHPSDIFALIAMPGSAAKPLQ